MKLLTAHKLSGEKGFTLIELLVVIGILGVLAAALVATIDPFEQLKKAQDANTKNTAVEFVNANIRYYTTHNKLPWVNDVGCQSQVGDSTIGHALSTLPLCSGALISDGELKSGFTTVDGTLAQIFISGNANNVVACFLPQSKATERDANTKFNSTGTTVSGNACLGQGGTSSQCYWCAQ